MNPKSDGRSSVIKGTPNIRPPDKHRYKNLNRKTEQDNAKSKEREDCHLQEPAFIVFFIPNLGALTIMAKFTDLSNELVFAITSFIRKPADILQLCLAERRSYELIQPLLYKNVIFNHFDYPNHRSSHGIRSMSSKISLFCQCIKQQLKENSRRNSDGPAFGRECRSLAVNVNARLTYANYDVIGVCAFVPFLKSFSLVSNPRFDDPKKDTRFKLDALGRALQPLRHTLESLTLFIRNQDYCWAAEGLGSLNNFLAMKKLCIQSQVLLCREIGLPTPLLSQILPPSLEDLTIHCCEHDSGRTDERWDVAHHVAASLDGKFFSTRNFEPDECLAEMDRRVIESVVVCLLDVPSCGMSVYRSLELKKSFDIVGRKVGLPGVKEDRVLE